MSDVAQILQQALQDPRRSLIDLDRYECKRSFYTFVQRAWHVLEPARPFIGGWAPRIVSKALQYVTDGKITRLLINIPPGCTKSMLTSVLWPAWEWGPAGLPANRIISASYEKGLATRDLVRCRDLLSSQWYQERWPLSFKEDENNKTKYDNDKTGWRLATSVGGALTGYRGDRIITDDPHDVKRAESDANRFEATRWWTETVPTRFNDPERSALVLMMQRLHVNDLSGHTIEKEGHKWTKLILPMEFEKDTRCVLPELDFEDPRTEDGELLWPERFSAKAVFDLKESLSSQGGSYAVAGQLQQRPVPREGGMFPRQYAQFVDHPPTEGRWCRGWDLAATDETNPRAAYTVGCKICVDGKRIYICDIVRDRRTPNGVEDMIKQTTRSDGFKCTQSFPQDPGQAGKSQKGSIAGLVPGYDVHFSPESGDKEIRAIGIAAQWEAGNVFLVRAPWNDAFLAEAELFPGSTYKDQVDALSRAYTYLVVISDGDLHGVSAPGAVEVLDELSDG